MSPTIEYTETLVVTHCWCGIALAIPANLDRQLSLDSKNECYCPLGHVFVRRDSYREKYEREQRQHRATKDLLAAEERSHAATRGSMTKLKKRIAAGVCPHCKRSFANLARHMQSKHAEECKA